MCKLHVIRDLEPIMFELKLANGLIREPYDKSEDVKVKVWNVNLD